MRAAVGQNQGVTEEKQKKPRVRGAMGRMLMRVPALRRWYIRRMLKYIDKSKAKGRKLPPEFVELSRHLARVPKDKRASALEEAMTAEREGNLAASREMRRAASAQQRRSGKGSGYRPGLPPGTLQQGRRQAKGQAKGR